MKSVVIPLLAAAAVAHLWDLATCLLAVPIVGAAAEIGPIGAIYASAGPPAAILWKASGFALAATLIAFASGRRPKASSLAAAALLLLGLLGALANTYALHQVLDALVAA